MNDPVALKLLSKAGEMPSLEPPEDESIKTLYVGGLDARVTEQDLRDTSTTPMVRLSRCERSYNGHMLL